LVDAERLHGKLREGAFVGADAVEKDHQVAAVKDRGDAACLVHDRGQGDLDEDGVGAIEVASENPFLFGMPDIRFSTQILRGTLAPEQDEALARTAAEELMHLPFLQGLPNSGAAYTISKRANALRVQAAAVEWGDRGARINSISPGIIFTPLAMDELNSAGGPRYREMMKVSAAGRGGTPDEVGAAAAYLMGPDGAFITGSDLLMDGGVIAAMRAGRL
jgi:hypothetical protein